jgi:RodZ C-terminal domain
VAAGVAGAAALGLVLTLAVGSGHGGNSPSHRAASAQTVPRTAPPTTTPATTVPAPAVLATSSSPDAAVYTVPTGPVSLVLTSTNRCWVELRSGSPTGDLVFQGVLSPGEHQTFSNLTGLWLRLGYPSGVTIQIDRTTITIPPSSSPFDITVLLAGSSPAA